MNPTWMKPLQDDDDNPASDPKGGGMDEVGTDKDEDAAGPTESSPD